jgi:glycine/D-amino acid oxidase-like deaminating enzyme
MAFAAGAGLYSLSGRGGALVPGVSRARAVTGGGPLPKAVDAVVIGGGFVGCMTALTLAERGIRVALCEKGVIAGEASGRSEGLIDGSFLDPVKQPLIARSKALWAAMNARVGADTGYRPSGLLSLFQTDEEVAAAEAWLASMQGMPGGGRMLSAAQIRRHLSEGPITWKGGLFGPDDASAEPRLAAPAMADAARARGAAILQGCAVRGVETTAGRISAVITEKGRIATAAVVLAGGVWSPVFARSLGLELPQFEAYSSQISIAPIPDGPRFSAWGGDVTWRREPDGGYAVCAVNGAAPVTPTTLRYLPKLLPALRHLWGELNPVLSPSTFLREWNIPTHWSLDEPSPFEALRILQPEIRNGLLDTVLADLRRNFPIFSQARERERWAGALVSTLDNMPVISAVGRYPGLYLGTGFYYGLTMGPAAGEALADLVTGRTPQVDLALYRYERFTDGSKLVFRD